MLEFQALCVLATILTVAGSTSLHAGQGRLNLEPAQIECRQKLCDGRRGTLRVPQDRARPDAGTVELPVVVVNSTAADPVPPIFQCTGGPGVSNIDPGTRIDAASLANHDVVQVGYRGIDGAPTLRHPLFDQIMRTPNLLSEPSLKTMGQMAADAVSQLRSDGVDVRHFGILDVVDDIETARDALGYEKINLTGGSYGGAVVLTYCLRYPQRVHRAVLVEAAFPYDIALGLPAHVDSRFEHLNALWKRDASAVKRSPDIVRTMRKVLADLPAAWNGLPIDRSKLEFVTYFGMYSERARVNMTFDAYVAAEKGDFSSLAVMSMMYDHLIGSFQNTGDLLSKTYSSVTDGDRDFITELSDPESIIGSPMSRAAWGAFQHSGWPVKSVAAAHPPTQKSAVETLLIYGSKEMGGPFKRRYGNNLTNAQWVMFDNLGHNDVWTLIGPGIRHLMLRFLNDGVVDTSKVGDIPPWDFTPKMTYRQMFQQMMGGQEKP